MAPIRSSLVLCLVLLAPACSTTRSSRDEARAPAEAVAVKPPDAPPASWIEKLKPSDAWLEGPMAKLMAMKGNLLQTMKPATDRIEKGFEPVGEFLDTARVRLTPSDVWREQHVAVSATLDVLYGVLYGTSLGIMFVLQFASSSGGGVGGGFGK